MTTFSGISSALYGTVSGAFLDAISAAAIFFSSDAAEVGFVSSGFMWQGRQLDSLALCSSAIGKWHAAHSGFR